MLSTAALSERKLEEPAKVAVAPADAQANAAQKEVGGASLCSFTLRYSFVLLELSFHQASRPMGIPLVEVRSELEPVLLSRDLEFEEKMAKLDEYFEKRPLLVASRLAKVTMA